MLYYVYKLETNCVYLLSGGGQNGILEFWEQREQDKKSKSEATTTSWKRLKSSTVTSTLHMII